jgi:hypothetical protein
MKGTTHFIKTISDYLEKQAEEDALFARYFASPDKNIDECIQYILHTVQQSGCNGFADEEIYGIAEEYYTADNIEVGKPVNCNIKVNHVVELTAEEKEEIHRNAIQKAQDDAYDKMMQQPKKKAKRIAINNQPTLFDF